MKPLNQSNYNYSVTINVNDEVYKTYYFFKKTSAYFFILNAVKPLAQSLVSDNCALVSASCYSHHSDKRRLLLRKNLTEVHF